MYTEQQLQALRDALANGVRRIKFADREVEYRDVAELKAAIAAAEADVAELVELRLGGDHARFGKLGAFADDHDGMCLALLLVSDERVAQVIDIDRDLWQDDVIGTDGNARETRDPPGMASHRFDDHDAAMGGCRGPQSVHAQWRLAFPLLISER